MCHYLKYNTSYTKRYLIWTWFISYNDWPRTNNYNTGYNNKFINILKREESLASIKHLRAISGYEADKIKKKDIEKDLKIETLIKEVEDDKIDLLEYVSEVSKLFHFRIYINKQAK